MTDPIISREAIAARAEQDAIRMIAQGLQSVDNPYPPISGAAVIWKCAFQRYLLKHSAPEDVEGSA
jgi:hypothetical protein